MCSFNLIIFRLHRNISSRFWEKKHRTNCLYFISCFVPIHIHVLLQRCILKSVYLFWGLQLHSYWRWQISYHLKNKAFRCLLSLPILYHICNYFLEGSIQHLNVFEKGLCFEEYKHSFLIKWMHHFFTRVMVKPNLKFSAYYESYL